MVVLATCKNKEEPIKNEGYSGHKIFPTITIWELSVTMETRVLIQSIPIPHLNNAPDDFYRPAGFRDIHV